MRKTHPDRKDPIYCVLCSESCRSKQAFNNKLICSFPVSHINLQYLITFSFTLNHTISIFLHRLPFVLTHTHSASHTYLSMSFSLTVTIVSLSFQVPIYLNHLLLSLSLSHTHTHPFRFNHGYSLFYFTMLGYKGWLQIIGRK